MSAMVPLLSLSLLALVQLSGNAIERSSTLKIDSDYKFLYVDPANHIDKELALRLGGTKTDDIDIARDSVLRGLTRSLIVYPGKLGGGGSIRIYENSSGFVANQLSTELAKQLLQRSVVDEIGNSDVASAATGTVPIERTGYRNGKIDNGVASSLPSLACLILFILMSMFIGNQLVSSFAEEREHKVREILFVDMKPLDVFLAKVLATLSIAGVQLAIMLTPLAIAYAGFGRQLGLPPLGSDAFSIEPEKIVMSILALVLGLAMMVALHGFLGVRAGSMRAAAPGQTLLMLMMVSPLYVFGAISEDPDAPVVSVMSIFPVSAPVTTLLRTASGNVSVVQFAIAAVLMCVVAFGAVVAAVSRYSGRNILMRRVRGTQKRPKDAG